MSQLAFDLRDNGMSAAFEAQDRDDPAWNTAALLAIKLAATTCRTVHVDDVARLTEGVLPPPHHPNAWGGVWMKAIRRGWIVRTGEVMPAGGSYKPHAHKHGRAYPVYRSLIFRGDLYGR